MRPASPRVRIAAVLLAVLAAGCVAFPTQREIAVSNNGDDTVNVTDSRDGSVTFQHSYLTVGPHETQRVEHWFARGQTYELHATARSGDPETEREIRHAFDFGSGDRRLTIHVEPDGNMTLSMLVAN